MTLARNPFLGGFGQAPPGIAQGGLDAQTIMQQLAEQRAIQAGMDQLIGQAQQQRPDEEQLRQELIERAAPVAGRGLGLATKAAFTGQSYGLPELLGQGGQTAGSYTAGAGLTQGAGPAALGAQGITQAATQAGAAGGAAGAALPAAGTSAAAAGGLGAAAPAAGGILSGISTALPILGGLASAGLGLYSGIKQGKAIQEAEKAWESTKAQKQAKERAARKLQHERSISARHEVAQWAGLFGIPAIARQSISHKKGLKGALKDLFD